MLLAGDVGGTKTLIGLFHGGAPRPEPVATGSFRTLDFPDLGSLAQKFLQDAGAESRELDAVCFGVAGPVKEQRAELTNVPWHVDAAAIGAALRGARVLLLNDLEALAWGVTVLDGAEVAVLASGAPDKDGGAALLAAGTGLGVALLPRVGGRLTPLASEGGHVDFAARTADEERLRTALSQKYGRAELEHVLSGPGLVNIHQFAFPHTCERLSGVRPDDLPKAISSAALEGGCNDCRKTLELFVSVYGAAAGDLALVSLATGGLFLGGGIAPRILEALRWPAFLNAFKAKAPLEQLMQQIPVSVILNEQAGLLGAAACAARASSDSSQGG